MFMKSRISVLIVLVLFAQAVMAQGVNFGIKGGANITKVDGKAFSDEFRYGYHLGGFVEIRLGGKIGIQPEVLFNQFQTRTGTDFSNVYPNGNNTSDVKLNYLTVPILLNYRLANVLTLQAGPQFGVLISQDKNILQNGQQAFSNGDLSLTGGVQLNLSKFRVNGRYFVGLNNVSDIGDQNKWTNQGFQLSLGLAF
jgi:hypothetical protein